MKSLRKAALMIILCIISIQINAQNKIAIDDQTELISAEIDLLLGEKFSSQQLEYNNMVDYKDRCKYYFAEIIPDQGDRWLKVMDCENNTIGEKKLSSGIGQMTDNDKAGMIVYTMMDIINNPDDQRVATKTTKKKAVTLEETTPPTSGINEHDSRYFFSPSSYNLKKGELYYNTLYFVLHDAQYGISDNFSVGMGTTLAAFPFYITPKYSFKLGEKHRAAIGDMFILGTWGTDILANLAYVTYTYGTNHSNITLGGGWLSMNRSNVFNDPNLNTAVINISGLAQLSNYMYFISENYVTSTPFQYQSLGSVSTAYYYTGIFGIRFINKTRDVSSIQAGLAYFGQQLPEPPPGYDITNRKIFIPMIGYTFKFGKKY